jgi:peptidoglycan/xylan/chitin deacetylase (PgdA/CDA1 family)
MSIYAQKGILIRLIYLVLAALWYGVTGAGRRFGRHRLVLCYHGINAAQRELFKSQMLYLRNHAVPVEMPKAPQHLRLRQGPVIAMTFDDAFENLIDNAIPVLNEFQIPGIVFAVPGNLGRTPKWAISPDHPESREKVMTAEQLVELSQNPLIRIGSHTMTHSNLATLTAEKVRQELAESKQQLELLLGHPVEDLALPHGAFNETVLQIARQAGYKRIYTLEPKVMPHVEMQNGVIGRFSMSPNVWPIEFTLTCAGGYSWLMGVRRTVQFIRHKRPS